MNKGKIHLIAIGGAAMHNIALDLKAQGFDVRGSDDEIYEPSLGRLQQAGIAPANFGWYPDRITSDIDMIILGMHAKADNPELVKALQLQIPVYSYPEFIYKHSLHKKRVVIAGSHGKTTTTAMVLHVLKKLEFDFDYLVGAQIAGFDRMVKLTDAPLIVIEGDEYLSSPIDRVSKILHYKPHLAVITGIAWDHINVFPTFDDYKAQFVRFIQTVQHGGTVFYYEGDLELQNMKGRDGISLEPYGALENNFQNQVLFEDKYYDISVIGEHNLQNLNAARLVCQELGIDADIFFKSISDFTGAHKRLQKISQKDGRSVYLDFAHAPSKVKATTDAFKKWFGDQKLLAVLELHTFSSLNMSFIPQYLHSLNAADIAVIFYNEHTLAMKNMPLPDKQFLHSAFGHPNLFVITDADELHQMLIQKKYNDFNILLMSSGNFNQMNLDI